MPDKVLSHSEPLSHKTYRVLEPCDFDESLLGETYNKPHNNSSHIFFPLLLLTIYKNYTLSFVQQLP